MQALTHLNTFGCALDQLTLPEASLRVLKRALSYTSTTRLFPPFLLSSSLLSSHSSLLFSPSLSPFPPVNRRMDEWVCLSRIDVGRGAVEEGPKELDFQLEAEFGRERKVTRNLKRKHDEINHVQKVGLREIREGEEAGSERKWESLWKQKMRGRMLGLTRNGGGMREGKRGWGEGSLEGRRRSE